MSFLSLGAWDFTGETDTRYQDIEGATPFEIWVVASGVESTGSGAIIWALTATAAPSWLFLVFAASHAYAAVANYRATDRESEDG